MEAKDKKPNNIELTNTFTYLLILKEEIIMKKALLDYCFREVKGIQLEYVEKEERIV